MSDNRPLPILYPLHRGGVSQFSTAGLILDRNPEGIRTRASLSFIKSFFCFFLPVLLGAAFFAYTIWADKSSNKTEIWPIFATVVGLALILPLVYQFRLYQLQRSVDPLIEVTSDEILLQSGSKRFDLEKVRGIASVNFSNNSSSLLDSSPNDSTPEGSYCELQLIVNGTPVLVGVSGSSFPKTAFRRLVKTFHRETNLPVWVVTNRGANPVPLLP